MAKEEKPKGFKDKATVVKSRKPDPVVSEKIVDVTDLVNIQRTRNDGVVLDRQCHRNDLPHFANLGFKLVKNVSPVEPAPADIPEVEE